MNAERNMLELYPEGETPDPTPNSNVIDAGTFDSSDPAPSTEETTALAVTDTNELPPGIYRNLDPSVVAKRDASGRFLKCSAAIESEEKTAAFNRGFMDSLQTVLSSSVEALDEPSQTAVEAAICLDHCRFAEHLGFSVLLLLPHPWPVATACLAMIAKRETSEPPGLRAG
jgi:hypothetical protein